LTPDDHLDRHRLIEPGSAVESLLKATSVEKQHRGSQVSARNLMNRSLKSGTNETLSLRSAEPRAELKRPELQLTPNMGPHESPSTVNLG